MNRCNNSKITNARRTINARVISGCRRQVVEVLLFLPVLILAIAAGMGLLILKFWLANWKPSLASGCFALAVFCVTPTIVFFYWMRWRMRPAAADAILTATSRGLLIEERIGTTQERLFEWRWIQKAQGRRMVRSIRTLKIVAHDPNRGRYVAEFALLAEIEHAKRLTTLVVRRVRWQERCSKKGDRIHPT